MKAIRQAGGFFFDLGQASAVVAWNKPGKVPETSDRVDHEFFGLYGSYTRQNLFLILNF